MDTKHYKYIYHLDELSSNLSVIEAFKARDSSIGLSLITDIRQYTLREKNQIKNGLDKLDIDNIKFTLRPSVSNFIKIQESNFDISKSINFISLVNVMIKYRINLGYIYKIPSLTSSSALNYNLFDVYENLIHNLFNFNLVDRNDNKFGFINKIEESNIRDLQIVELSSSQDMLGWFPNNPFEDQISPLEKNIFWIGFDNNFKEVEWNVPHEYEQHELTPENLADNNEIFLKYCSRCLTPESMEGIEFDELGICTPCRSSEQKMHIEWDKKRTELENVIRQYENASYYDCLLPMSGGKDSTFQAYYLTQKLNITPLAVTHGANWMSITGRYNLENCLVKFDLDHVMFHARRSIINRVSKVSLESIGDACWHCHIGSGSFSMDTAVRWKLPLTIWGESIAERDGRSTYSNVKEASPYYNLEVSALKTAEEISVIGGNIQIEELSHWKYPEKSEINNSKIRYLHLGNYIFWDEQKQIDFIVDNYDWWNSKVENTYKGYKSTECVMAGVHDYLNFIKRGIGRGTVHASDDVRRGIITREEGRLLANKYDFQIPHALKYLTSISGLSIGEVKDLTVKARKISKFASKLNKKKRK